MAVCYYCNGSARCAGCGGTGVQADGRVCALCGGNGRCQRCTNGQMFVSEPVPGHKAAPPGLMRSGIRLALLAGTALATLAWSEAAWADCVTSTAGDGTVTLACGNTITSSNINHNGNNPSTVANYQAIEAPINVTLNSGVTISGWGLIVYNGTQPASATSRPLNVVNNGMVSHTVGWDDPSESDGLNIGTNSGPIRYSGNGSVTTNGTANAIGNFAGSTALVIGASGLGNSVTVGSQVAPVSGTFTGEGGMRLVAENSSLDAWFAGGTITATRRESGIGALDIQAADSINLSMTGGTVVNGGIGVSLTAGPGHNLSSLLTIATNAQVTNAYSAGAGLTAFSREAGATVTLTSGALFNVANIGVLLLPNGGAAHFTTAAGTTINQTGTTGAVRTGLWFTPTGTGSLVADLSGTIAATGTGLLLQPVNGNATIDIRSGASVSGDVAGIQLSQSAGGTGLVDIRNFGTLAGSAAVAGTTTGTAFTLANSGTMNGAVNLAGSAVSTSLLTNSGTWNLGTGNSAFSGSVTNSGTLNLSDASGAANTLTVSGNLTFGAGSNARLDVGSTQPGTDRILVSGTATLAGGLTAIARGGAFTGGTYTLLTANGGISGSFSPLSTIPASPAALRYDANNVFLDVSLANNQSFSMSSRESLVFNAPSVTTNRVTIYSTQVLGRLNGGTLLYDQTFGVPFSDPAAQAGIEAARAAITTAGGPGLIIGAPVLTASSTTTATTSSTLYSVAGSNTTTTSETTFGPADIQTGVLSSCSVGSLPSAARPACTTGGTTFHVGDAEENFNIIQTTQYTIDQATSTTSTTTQFEQWTLFGTVQAFGIVHTAVQSGALDANLRFLRRLGDEANVGTDEPFHSWVEGYGVWSHEKAQGGISGDNRNQYGFAGGISALVMPDVTLGVGIDHGNTDITLDRAFVESGGIDLTQIGVNAGLTLSPWFANLAATYGFGDADTAHAIGAASTASYGIRTWGMLAETGYRFDLDGFDVAPSVGFDHTDMRSDDFTETGGLALTANGYSTGRTRIWAGLDVGQRLGNFDWSVNGRLVDAVAGNERLLPVTFFNAPMMVMGISEAEIGGDAGVRVSYKIMADVDLFARYDGRFRDGFTAHAATAGMTVSF